MIRLLLSLIFICSEVNASSFKIELENDILTQTDYYYSNGLLIEYQLDKLGKLQPWKLLSDTGHSGISMKHDISTPTDTGASTPQANDYPYSAVLYSTFFNYEENENYYKRRELLIGFIGPMAMGEPIQNGIHGIFPSHSVNGWEHQLNNDILLNYNYEYWKKYSKSSLVYGPWYRAEVGTFTNQFHFAYKSRLNFFKRHSIDLRAGAYLSLYNAKLQGGVFSSNTNNLSSNDLENLVYEGVLKYRYRISHHEITLGNTFIGVQFKGGKPHSWTTLSYRYHF